MFDQDGKLIDAEEASEYEDLLWDDLVAEAFKYSKAHQDSIDVDLSFADFLSEKVQSLFTDESAKEAERKRETLLRVAKMWGAYVGSPIERQSLRNFWLEECIEGENLVVAETYREILDEVAKTAVAGAELRLNSKVVRISSHADDMGAKRSRASIHALNGLWDFDEVVVTTPLGWLKRNQQAFEPRLPQRLAQAIDSVGYGTLDKVYITFPLAFWDVPLPSEQEIPNGIDRQRTTPDSTGREPLRQPTLQSREKHYAGFTHYMSPAYASTINPRGWDQEAMNLAALPASCAHPTLLFYTYGDCSLHIAAIVTDSPSEEERDAKLLDFFKPYYSLLPNFDEEEPACKPKAVLATAWANDEFAGYGSYSNFQIGLEDGAREIEVMRHGMPERSVWFAGEHTAPFDSSGTTSGAYMSGDAVANRIAQVYSLERFH